MGRQRSNDPEAAGSHAPAHDRTIHQRKTQDPTTPDPGDAAQLHSFPDVEDANSGGLTHRQRRVLEVIREWVERFGAAIDALPNLREPDEVVALLGLADRLWARVADAVDGLSLACGRQEDLSAAPARPAAEDCLTAGGSPGARGGKGRPEMMISGEPPARRRILVPVLRIADVPLSTTQIC